MTLDGQTKLSDVPNSSPTMTDDESTIELVFSVRCPNAKEWEFMMLTGNVPELGDWLPDNAVGLTRSAEDRTLWTTTVRLSREHKEVGFRYFICQWLDSAKDSSGKCEMAIVRWETHLLPRKVLPALHDKTKFSHLEAEFGFYGGKEMTDVGWLIHQSEIRLRVQQNSLEFFKSRHKYNEYAIKVTPIDLRFRETFHYDDEPDERAAADRRKNWRQMTIAESMGSLDLESTHHDEDSRDVTDQPLLPSHNQTRISILSGNTYEEYNFHEQKENGQRFDVNNDYFMFKTQTVAPEFLAFLIDIYVPDRPKNASDDTDKSTPSPPAATERVGFCYLLPSNMSDTCGQTTIPITSRKHLPIGQLNLNYLIVHAMRTPSLDRFIMDVSYARNWKKRQTLNVGHRGMGNSYTKMCVVRENTTNSFSEAGKHGADFVEFDVQLSRDRVPVIYHDFHVFVTIFKKYGSTLDLTAVPDDDDASLHMHKLAVKDLRLSQLRMLKLTHGEDKPTPKTNSLNSSYSSDTSVPLPAVLQKGSARRWDVTGETEDGETDPDDAPFPTLHQVLTKVDTHVGFNIEVKYPMMQENGVHECEHYWERNVYIDTILAEVFKHKCNRRILFSSFDPDICTILRLKQNKYPVLFLTMGSHTTRYVPLHDRRCSNTIASMNFAHSTKLLGVNLHSEDVLRDPTHLAEAAKRKLITFVWGDDLDNKEHQKFLRDAGVDGLVYDRIDDDKSSDEASRRNIFVVEKEKKNDLFRMRSRSPCTMDDSSVNNSRANLMDLASPTTPKHVDDLQAQVQLQSEIAKKKRAENGRRGSMAH